MPDKRDLGLIKTITVSLGDDKLRNKVNSALERHGFQKSGENQYGAVPVELADAWSDIQASLRKMPGVSSVYSEGASDEESDEFFYDYEALEVKG